MLLCTTIGNVLYKCCHDSMPICTVKNRDYRKQTEVKFDISESVSERELRTSRTLTSKGDHLFQQPNEQHQ